MRINSSFERADILARLDSIVKSMPKGDAQIMLYFIAMKKLTKLYDLTTHCPLKF